MTLNVEPPTTNRHARTRLSLAGLALTMCQQLAHKTRWTLPYAETLVRYKAAGRLLNFLLLYNEEFGQEIAPGQYVLALGFNQTDLASLVSARRCWVNRILQDWRTRGLVSFEAGKITILDLGRVQKERDSWIEGGQDGW